MESGSPDTLPRYPYAVACPAMDKNERKLNRRQSFDHKALFVRDYYGTKEDLPIETKTCETSIELAAVFYHKNTIDEIDFGYEVI